LANLLSVVGAIGGEDDDERYPRVEAVDEAAQRHQQGEAQTEAGRSHDQFPSVAGPLGGALSEEGQNDAHDTRATRTEPSSVHVMPRH
jgi:hypothetical protein